MILVRSIRRRLVAGFSVAFILQLILAGMVMWAVLGHQNAVEKLNFLVHESPDRDRLRAAVAEIPTPLFNRVNLANEAAFPDLRIRIGKNLNAAQREAHRFWRRAEDLPKVAGGRPDLGRGIALRGTMEGLERKLARIARMIDELRSFPQLTLDRRIEEFNKLKTNIVDVAGDISLSVGQLPDEAQLSASLEREILQTRSAWRWNIIVVIVALISNAVALWCGFRWIVNPARAAAAGASRIANGDIQYRLPRLTPWNDEFANLTDNFNRMADRFLEAEQDLEAKVEERSRQLLRSERLASIGILSTGLAHEINNPLSGIKMAASSALMRFMEDELLPEDRKDVEEALQEIMDGADNCAAITHQMLDFSREKSVEKVQDDLTRIVGEVIALIRALGKFDGCTINFDRAEPLLAEFNATQMKQVVLNLLINAIHATDKAGHVTIQLKEMTDWVVLDILDDGQGMTTETLENLFEPFYTTKEGGDGTGLGLCITNRIIDEHGGILEPFSEGEGQGSRFRVRLPRRQSGRIAA